MLTISDIVSSYRVYKRISTIQTPYVSKQAIISCSEFSKRDHLLQEYKYFMFDQNLPF